MRLSLPNCESQMPARTDRQRRNSRRRVIIVAQIPNAQLTLSYICASVSFSLARNRICGSLNRQPLLDVEERGRRRRRNLSLCSFRKGGAKTGHLFRFIAFSMSHDTRRSALSLALHPVRFIGTSLFGFDGCDCKNCNNDAKQREPPVILYHLGALRQGKFPIWYECI